MPGPLAKKLSVYAGGEGLLLRPAGHAERGNGSVCVEYQTNNIKSATGAQSDREGGDEDVQSIEVHGIVGRSSCLPCCIESKG